MKSVDKSLKLRSDGNQKFKMKDLPAAVDLYIQAIAVAPKDTECLNLGFGNRSAALLELGNFQGCQRDIKRALSGQKLQESVRTKLEKRAELAEIGIQKFKNTNKEHLQISTPDLHKGSNPKVPCVSASIQLRSNPEFGRHFVAKEMIPKGSVVLVESAYTSILVPDFAWKRCHFCIKPLPLDPIPCTECAEGVLFCEEACRDGAWAKFHWAECGALERLRDSGIAHLALRTLLSTADSDLLAEGNLDSEVQRSNYRTVASLEAHETETLPEDGARYDETSMALAGLLSKKQFFKLHPELGADRVMMVLGRLIRMLICNAHAITACSAGAAGQAVEDWGQDKVAAALFPIASLMNHSCQPNVFSSFMDGRTLIARAVEDLQTGQQLFTCYGPKVGRRRRKERQEALMQQYFFHCQCLICISSHWAEAEVEAEGFLCPDCSGLTLPSPLNSSVKVVCRQCRKQSEFQLEDLAALEQLVGEWAPPSSLQELTDALQLVERFLHPHNSRLAELRDSAARRLADYGNFEAASVVLEKNLESVQRRFGAESIEVGEELVKIVQLRQASGSHVQNSEYKKQSDQLRTSALSIFSVHYGYSHQTVAYLKSIGLD